MLKGCRLWLTVAVLAAAIAVVLATTRWRGDLSNQRLQAVQLSSILRAPRGAVAGATGKPSGTGLVFCRPPGDGGGCPHRAVADLADTPGDRRRCGPLAHSVPLAAETLVVGAPHGVHRVREP